VMRQLEQIRRHGSRALPGPYARGSR
jgi:hypothetical protein